MRDSTLSKVRKAKMKQITFLLVSLLIMIGPVLSITYDCINSSYPSASCCEDDIKLSTSITNIREYAFFYCTSLKSVDATDSLELMTIGDSAFSRCTQLSSISLPSCVLFEAESAARTASRMVQDSVECYEV